MSQVVHTVYEIQAFHLSSQTHSPAYRLQRGSWASIAPHLCATSPASLKWLKHRPEWTNIWGSCSLVIPAEHTGDKNQRQQYSALLRINHTGFRAAFQSSVFVSDGQVTSLLTDTYRETRISKHLRQFPKFITKCTQAYFHVVELTGNLSGRPGESGRTGLVQGIGDLLSFMCHNQVEVEREDFVILKDPIK